jgi:FtsP/CotA-like multicopper oxidase with cupredoxin domain
MKVPEIITKDGKLRGVVVLSDEQEWMAFRVPVSAPSDQSSSQCLPQYVRTFRELGAVPTMASTTSGNYAGQSYAVPRPGPTLRAKLGDLVQLTFINQINPSDFGNSIDRGETGVGGGCDESSSGYPSNDKYPDCFHGSSTGNIHFHGTHTNPNETGDNVFIEVRPSLRDGNKPVVTPESVRKPFEDFFARCEAKLSHSVLREWPKTWGDLPKVWTDEQEKLLKQYDKQLEKNYGSGVSKLWPVDEAQLKQEAWPQYYIGAYPYCFRLPEYKAQTWPPPTPSPMQMNMGAAQPTHGGAGTAEQQSQMGMDAADEADSSRDLIMGQSPGTHWYHAHKHGSTAINVANGMTGAFIIEGQYDEDLNNWYGDGWTRTQKVMVINQLGVSPNLLRGGAAQIDKGPDFAVNGQLRPVVQMRPGEVQMWRIVNTSGRAGAFFNPPPKDTSGAAVGYEWKQLAQDGVQFKNENYINNRNRSFLMAPGNRVDLLVRALPCPNKQQTCTYPVLVQNEVDPSDRAGANKLTLLSVTVSGTPLDPTSKNANFIPQAPGFPPFLTDITADEVKGTKKIVFATDPKIRPTVHMIDGKKFDGEVGAVVLLNTVEEWKIVNETFGPPISHPFHIHINPFQITEVFDPNEPLIDPKTGKTPIDPKTGKPWIDPQTQKVAVKYTFHEKNRAPGQCYLDPDADPNDWKPCNASVGKNLIWWDVFPIPSGYSPTTDAAGKVPLKNKQGQAVKVPGYFKMRSRFVDYSGFYVIHCHILAHEDRGMMTIVEVAPARTPYSHH